MISKLAKIYLYVVEYISDFLAVVKFNSYSPFEDKQKRLFYRIVILTHTVEKGLSLDSPKKLFGREKLRTLMSLIRNYDSSYSLFPLQMASGALESYLELHAKSRVKDDFLLQVSDWLDEINTIADIQPTGGYKLIENFGFNVGSSHSDFMSSRFSCRAYRDELVDPKLLREIILTAQSAPSQCNRQSSRVHCYQEKNKIKELLTLQSGSAGFIDSVSNLFVVTSELTAWGGAGQRNQAYVDGALFSMSLMLSCQAFGVATCPLNLAILNKVESKIKNSGNIHGRERLIMMIAFGYPIDSGLKAASSPRLLIDDVLKIH